MYVTIVSLWLPILLSAVAVFIASAVLWMAVQHHDADWQGLPDEEAARRALAGTPPGSYTVPHATGNAERRSEEWQRKFREGPAAMLTIVPHGNLAMGRQLAQWFVYCLVISVFVAYVAGAALPAGASYLGVFRVTATVAWLAYCGQAAANAIWFHHGWGRTAKDILDGLVYALLTGGIFGWLWP